VQAGETHVGHVPQHPQDYGEEQTGNDQQTQEDAFLGPQGIAAVQDFGRFIHSNADISSQ
jgi:hypothetical protein